MSSELSSLFAAYHWPGNIRQLEMTLRLLLAMREPGEQELDLMHLPDNLLDELRGSAPPSGGGRMRDSQLALIRQAMDRHGGNVTAAAQALGVSRATLYRKLKQAQP